MIKSILLLSCLTAPAFADFRMASQPRKGWEVQQRNRDVPFVLNPKTQKSFPLYMEPSDFGYEGLKKQRDGGGYDNFLRSNIDNEQDRRNFEKEEGKDHLPFRSYDTSSVDTHESVQLKMVAADPLSSTGVSEPGNYIFAVPGEPYTVPVRWNNPHSSELEVNIWVMNKAGGPHVIHIKKPCCSGEGYQDGAFTFTVPTDFTEKASCKEVGECVLQVYAHSVESRMYSCGTPIVVRGSDGTWDKSGILEAQKDTAFDFTKLRRLCLPSTDQADVANYKTTVIHKARLSSDVYNHAYQNSDFSPYAGQQPQHISQNLQASCILKMTVGNFGELGKKYIQKEANAAAQYAKKLDKKARNLIRIYETTTNSIIEAIKYEVANNATLEAKEYPDHTECTKWRDQWDKNENGRLRGIDRTGGYCKKSETCMCKGDCYKGYGKGDLEIDAYCGVVKGMKVQKNYTSERIGVSPQRTEKCFRCAEVGSTKKHRQNTNTYIPSFEVRGKENVNEALRYIPPAQLESGYFVHADTGEICTKDDGQCVVQIYMATLYDMWEEFKNASTGDYLEEHYKHYLDKLKKKYEEDLEGYDNVIDLHRLNYRGPVLKLTTTTLEDETNYKKLGADGNPDGGYYAAKTAWSKQEEGKSKYAVPNRKGPIHGSAIIKSFNMAGEKYKGESSPNPSAANLKPMVWFPPQENKAKEICRLKVEASRSSSDTFEITPEGVDMNGVNKDADCDNDAAIEASNTKHDEMCAKEQKKFDEEGDDAVYKCPEYPEVECHIEGENAQRPSQLFADEGAEPTPQGSKEEEETTSSASSLAGLAVASLLVLV